MYTQCPQCMTYFQVTAEHLKIAQGNVRCGHCRNVFSALGNLTEHLPEPTDTGQDHFDSQRDELIESDFLTDEELGEFEDFDTNIYDDEDSIFDAFIDEEETDATVPETSGAGDTPADTTIEETTKIAAATAVPNQVTATTNVSDQPTPGKKLPSLEEGRKAYLEKLKQANLTKQQSASPLDALLSEHAPVQTVPDTQTTPTESERTKTRAAPAPKSVVSPAANTAEAEATTNTAATAQSSQKEFLDVKHTLTRKPDIPVETSGDEVDFDTALQAIDELEINDEHADFVASVVKEFQATNISDPAPAQNTVSTKRTKPDANETKNGVPQTPPASISNKQSVQTTPAATQSTVQPVPETLVPTLPAILREGYQQEAVHHHRMTPAAIAWGVGSLILMLFFLGQTVYFKHDQLARIGTFRPWIEAFCRHFDCEIALQFDAGKLELLGQDIRSHPKVQDALLVSTTIINNASYRQPYPGLQITFTDMNGQKVAMRRFLPEEYLAAGTTIKEGMPPNTPIQVEIELMDPGSSAINFEFEFFKSV